MSRTPGLHNLTREIMREQIEDLSKIGLSHALELGLAQSVIINTLGSEFWAKECTTFGSKQTFFSEKSDVRIIHLAHMLWELRAVSGFEAFLNRIKRDDFEAAYYELYFAYLFAEAAHSVELVVPVGARGSDFDVRVMGFKNFGQLNVEVKARKAVFTSTDQARDFLNKARTQLPKGEKGAIVMKVARGQSSISQDELHMAIASCLRVSERLAFVLYLWDASGFDNSIALAHVFVESSGPVESPFKIKGLIVPGFIRDAEVAGYRDRVAPE